MSATVRQAGPMGFARGIISAWAYLGGLLLLTVVLINVISVVGAVVWKPFPGDFELTEVGVAVAAFAFLPYCQMTRANVTADIFTSWLSTRSVAALTVVASMVAIGFSLLLLSRMWAGLLDQKAYGYTTAILQFPHWLAFVPILVSLVLLCVAAVVTLVEDIQDLRKAGPNG